MTNRSMGEIISTLRKEKGMTQKQLADLLDITDKAPQKCGAFKIFKNPLQLYQLNDIIQTYQ